MTTYEKFRKLDIDFSEICLEPAEDYNYFCTPKGARVIGFEGVDGIHYCFVKGFGEMVFAVNPSNSAGECVHPLARSFGDFLRLLLACGSVAAVEQAWMMDRGEFDDYLKNNPPDTEQQAIFDIISEKLCLTPMEDPYGYIKEVQSEFDYEKIPYKKEYYDLVSDVPAPAQPTEWKVYFGDGLGCCWQHYGHDRPGIEIPVNKTFTWGGHTWHIPAVYSCGKGLVADFCVEVDPAAIKAFLEKWNTVWDEGRPLTREEEEQQNAEDPLRVDFSSKVTVNGREMRYNRGSSSNWIPKSCRGEGWEKYNQEALWVMEHYGLNAEMGWIFWRAAYPWSTAKRPKLKTLSVSLEQNPRRIPGLKFTVSGAGDEIPFTDPITGENHTLKVLEYESKKADLTGLPTDEWEYPTYYTALSYSVEPSLPREAFSVRDRGRGDDPRSKKPQDGASTMIIGFVTDDDHPQAICSHLRFEPPKQIEWQLVFFHKTAKDMEIELPLTQD